MNIHLQAFHELSAPSSPPGDLVKFVRQIVTGAEFKPEPDSLAVLRTHARAQLVYRVWLKGALRLHESY